MRNSLVERCLDTYLRHVGLEAGRALLDAWLLRVGDLGRNGGPVASVLFTLCAQRAYTPSPQIWRDVFEHDVLIDEAGVSIMENLNALTGDQWDTEDYDAIAQVGLRSMRSLRCPVQRRPWMPRVLSSIG